MKKKISFVIPCYCSENTIKEVVDEIDNTMIKQDLYVYEIILVNDSSPDGTFDTIKQICENNVNVIGIDMAKNFGQHSTNSC